MYTAVYMRRAITCHGSTAQQQSAFSLEAGPAIGNEALAGTRRSVFFGGGDVALYCSDSIHETAATPSVSLAAVVTRTTLSTRQQLRPPFRWPQL